jgi:hypothetical protein
VWTSLENADVAAVQGIARGHETEKPQPLWLLKFDVQACRAFRSHADLSAADGTVRVIHPSRVRLCVTQTRPVVRHFGLSSEQRTQFALLLGDEHTDHLPTHLRHADPAHISDTSQPEQH